MADCFPVLELSLGIKSNITCLNFVRTMERIDAMSSLIDIRLGGLTTPVLFLCYYLLVHLQLVS
jgi:hypothetical protein